MKTPRAFATPEFPARPRHQVAVVGGSSAPAGTLRLAEAVGREIAVSGGVLVCGGLGGVMEAACRGAAEAGGLTVGILPGGDRGAANRFVRCAIPTGLGHFRNFLVVSAADGVVALPGGTGTLSEVAMALTLGRPVAVLGGGPDGDGSRVPGTHAARSPEEAVACVISRTSAAGRHGSRVGAGTGNRNRDRDQTGNRDPEGKARGGRRVPRARSRTIRGPTAPASGVRSDAAPRAPFDAPAPCRRDGDAGTRSGVGNPGTIRSRNEIGRRGQGERRSGIRSAGA